MDSATIETPSGPLGQMPLGNQFRVSGQRTLLVMRSYQWLGHQMREHLQLVISMGL